MVFTGLAENLLTVRRGTAFLATIFYPTHQKPHGTPKPYLNPETAEFYEQNWGYTPGILASLTSTIQEDAPFLEPTGLPGKGEESLHLPTILFGPGGGGTPVEGSTILLSELASYGYAVIGLDHPFEQPFIRYPNGTGVWGVDLADDILTSLYETRLGDNDIFIYRHLPELVQKFGLPLSTTNLGIFGYSLGGAGGLGSLIRNSRITSGINLDGTMIGDPASNSSSADARKPVFLIGHEGHYSGDSSWVTFTQWQTGYQRRININGTTHLDFCDNTFWKTLESSATPHAGPIDGFEQIKILNAYVKAFFDLTLLGKNSIILDEPSPDFPEVVLTKY